MKVISIVNQKGGVGKSTIAVNLALHMALKRKVVVLDSDPQKSTLETISSRKDKPLDIEFTLEPHSRINAYNDHDICIIDTPPHNDKIAAIAVICSDLVLIPVQDSPMDIRATKTTITLVRKAQEKKDIDIRFVISRIQPNTILARELPGYLKEMYGIEPLQAIVCNRVAYKQATIYGQSVVEYEPAGNAAKEIKNLTKEIMKLW
jgi:chromosome partitioning protein